MPRRRKVEYCVAVSNELLGDDAAVPLQGDLESAFALASNLGFDSVELHARNPASLDAGRLRGLCADHDLRIAALGTGLEYSLNANNLVSADPKVRRRMSEGLKTYIDLAASFDAVVFLGLCRGKSPSFSEVPAFLDTLAGELGDIASYAKAKAVRLALEPIVFYLTNLLNTTRDCLEFLAAHPDLGTIGFLLDTHHMFIEDGDIAEAFRSAAGRIEHVHISDSNRRYPGGGHIDYDLVGRTLKEIDYAHAVSLEIVPFPTGVEAARNGIAWMKRVWGP